MSRSVLVAVLLLLLLQLFTIASAVVFQQSPSPTYLPVVLWHGTAGGDGREDGSEWRDRCVTCAAGGSARKPLCTSPSLAAVGKVAAMVGGFVVRCALRGGNALCSMR